VSQRDRIAGCVTDQNMSGSALTTLIVAEHRAGCTRYRAGAFSNAHVMSNL